MGVCMVVAVAVAAAAFLGIFLAVDDVSAMVSINKINLFSCYGDLPSFTSAPTSTHHHQDPFFSAPHPSLHASTSCSHQSCRSLLQPGSSSSSVGLTAPPPPGILA